MFDIILLGGTLIDGTGANRYESDIGIAGGRIEAVGDLRDREAQQILDASNMYIAPGFIDMHAHSDLALLADSRAASKLNQGVTTEICGQCGISAAPLFGRTRKELPVWMNMIGVEPAWTHMREYLELLEWQGLAINFGTMVGHSNLRYAVTLGENRALSQLELIEMRVILAQSLEEGALGLSSGLFYAPSSYGDEAELSALGGTLDLFDGIYATHIRNEGSGLFDALNEAIQVGKSADVPVHISHLKLASRSMWGKAGEVLDMLDRACEQGADLSWDQYPYTAAATMLDSVVPPRFHSGGLDALLRRLRDAGVYAAIIEAMKSEVDTGWENMAYESGWEHMQISSHPTKPGWVGRTIADLAREAGRDPYEFVLDMILETHSQVEIIDFCMQEGDVEMILRHPQTIIASDAQAVAPDGILGKGAPHPRAYGTYPRVLGYYVRERGTLTWEEAIHKMSAMPAIRLNIKSRGLIQEGYFADLVVFDADSIADQATYTNPHRYPIGIQHVLVNGELALQDGEQTEARAGKVLRGSE